MMRIESSGAVTMPPIIGAAIRLMISEPAPVPITIGVNPAGITATVVALGRTQCKVPERMPDSTSLCSASAC